MSVLHFPPAIRWQILFGMIFCLLVTPTLAQRPYTVFRPAVREAGEKVTVSRKASQTNKGILAVVLQPIIAGKVTITDLQGRVLEQAETDNTTGQVEFELRRGASFIIKATSPGYLAAEIKTKMLKSPNVVRLPLIAQFAKLELPGLPPNAQLLIDNQPRASADPSGFAALADLTPGNHTLIVRHPEYNDYKVTLEELKAGDVVTLPSLRSLLTKVAKLTIQSQPNAIVMIDGEFQGRINANGQVQIDYQLAQVTEHTIAIELPGYQTWMRKEMLTPGPRKLEIKLEPVVTSAGATDGFANLAQWSHPASWKIASEKSNEQDINKLQVSGTGIGLLKEKTYRDFTASFTVWLSDEKGASWIVRARAGKTEHNYYLFHLSGTKAGDLTPRRLYTYRVKDGQISEVETPTPMTFEFKPKDSYYVTITVSGNQIKHTLIANSTAEPSGASYTDTFTDKDQFLYGSFGFTSFKGETFLVDDLAIEPAPESSAVEQIRRF
jgi:hypothetical protein